MAQTTIFLSIRVVDTLAPTTLFRAFKLGFRRRTRRSRLGRSFSDFAGERVIADASVSALLARTSRSRRALRTCGPASAREARPSGSPDNSAEAEYAGRTAVQPAWLNQIRYKLVSLGNWAVQGCVELCKAVGQLIIEERP